MGCRYFKRDKKGEKLSEMYNNKVKTLYNQLCFKVEDMELDGLSDMEKEKQLVRYERLNAELMDNIMLEVDKEIPQMIDAINKDTVSSVFKLKSLKKWVQSWVYKIMEDK